ncbi:putative Late embryogenesis abundant protein [Helianthus annuus]|uniref:Putative late embryogenesis abundant (LEA) hydroxyproline-rich glycoprotein family n=1 Tax=Helianthus annuus TaxID=4232 RepID=A0A251SVQ4_HELAN|nr:uncharacterized protein LOC110899510 [Helianthus annuus]KAJ0859603.1 putative Late embryogenesis abundant protein [Helianthus annuus]
MPPHRKNPPPLPPPPTGRTTLSSCIVATIFLTFITIIILIIFFTLFKPQPPTISLTAVKLPSFSVTNATVTFTLSHYVAVYNPNHGVFTHYDTSVHLLFAGDQMGFLFVPAGKIEARRKVYLAATFSVKSFPVDLDRVNGFGVGLGLEVELRMEMAGRVRVMHFFMHDVEAKVECKVAIGISDGSVLGFRC